MIAVTSLTAVGCDRTCRRAVMAAEADGAGTQTLWAPAGAGCDGAGCEGCGAHLPAHRPLPLDGQLDGVLNTFDRREARFAQTGQEASWPMPTSGS